MKLTLLLAGIRLCFLVERTYEVDAALQDFIVPEVTAPDVVIHIRSEWSGLSLPESSLSGEDRICRYYREGNRWYCLTKGRTKEPLACSVYGQDMREICCCLNGKHFLKMPENLGSILRMIPIRAIYQQFGVLFFHASRICFRGHAILFAGPSGVGKTTQAGLWNRWRDAQILCNDRTLLRKAEGVWYSYAHPLDGSEPVGNSRAIPVDAVVVLRQKKENRTERLGPGKAVSALMQQLVIDVWNPEACSKAMEDLLDLLTDIPVYLLECTADERAVEILEQTLRKDEVIADE